MKYIKYCYFLCKKNLKHTIQIELQYITNIPKMKNKLITLVTLIVLINRGQAQNTDYLGVRFFNGPGGVLFTNSEGKTLEYNKRLSSGWGIQYGHQAGSFMVEAGCTFSQTNSSYNEPGLNTDLSMDFFRTSLSGAYLLFKAPVRLKLGAGLGTGHLLSGYQINNDERTDIVAANTFKKTEFTAGGEAGLMVQASEKIQIQLSYYYRSGISNLENITAQSTKINANGLQATIYFGL